MVSLLWKRAKQKYIIKEMKNIYWTVYKNGEIISVAKKQIDAKQIVLDLRVFRWTYATFNEAWKRALKEGFTIGRSIIIPVKSIKEAKELLEEL